MRRGVYGLVALLGVCDVARAQATEPGVARPGVATANRGVAGGANDPSNTAAPTRVRNYRAPPECPAASVFWQEVNARTPGGEAPGGQVSVEIERQAGHYTGRMVFGTGAGQSERSVVGAACDETSTAIALVVALAFAAQRQERTKPEPESDAGARLGLEILGLLDDGLARPLAFGAGAGLRIATEDRRAELGIVLGYRSVEAEALGQGFGVRVLSLRVDACPVVIDLGAGFGITPCAFVDAGGVQGRGTTGFSNTAGPVYEPWGGIGALARVSLRMGAGFSIALIPAAEALFKRGYQFTTRDPGSGNTIPLYEVPDWALFGAAGVRYDWD